MGEPVEVQGQLVGVAIAERQPGGLGFPIAEYVVTVRLVAKPAKPVLALGRKLKLVFEDEVPGPEPQEGAPKHG